MLDLLALLRWPVAAATLTGLVLLVARWRAWMAAPPLWRLLAVSLGMHMAATLIGTLTAIAEDKAGGGQVPAYLLAALAAIYALAARDRRHPTTSEED